MYGMLINRLHFYQPIGPLMLSINKQDTVSFDVSCVLSPEHKDEDRPQTERLVDFASRYRVHDMSADILEFGTPCTSV